MLLDDLVRHQLIVAQGLSDSVGPAPLAVDGEVGSEAADVRLERLEEQPV